MYKPGNIVSHTEICLFEGFTVQQGMNFHTGKDNTSVLLMSTTNNAPYQDEVQDNGQTIIYEGHDLRKDLSYGDPKQHDQPLELPSGKPTANGKFYQAAQKEIKENVRVYEKLKPGIWVYSGTFLLQDAYIQDSHGRKVIKFKLKITDETNIHETNDRDSLEQTRVIPSKVKFEVFKRDHGQCVICGSTENLHYDHILPYSKGGTSLKTENIQILCAKHNLAKSNKIE